MEFKSVDESIVANVSFSFCYRGYTISSSNILNKPHIVGVCYWSNIDDLQEMYVATTVESAIIEINSLISD